ncbi:MAG: DUF5666 domain-containing protein [Halieaceae bacterium]|jgi:hypothetical protein|nr:DUF5666 domain-containing protein [Halieaceae bacterium]
MKPIFEPGLARKSRSLLTAGSLLVLGACGGGGGGGDQFAGVIDPGLPGGGAGIGGTGFSSRGTVDGTGSIFVNGVRYNVDDADIFVDGEPATEADLGLGMVVNVSGTRDDDGNSVADRVNYNALIEGDIEAIERNADGSSARVQILGQTVILERTSTVFENRRFENLGVGDRIEISGFVDNEGRIRATRVNYDDDRSDEVTISGRIRDLDGLSFRIGGQRIDASSARFDDLSPDNLRNGLSVEVDGQIVDGVLVAAEVDDADDFIDSLERDADISAQGAIRDFENTSRFIVDDVPVDASGATLDTGGLPLAEGLVVEIEGDWDGRALVATRVTARRGRIELEAPLAAIDGNTLTLEFGIGTVSVEVDSRTLLDDDRDDIEYLSIGDLAIGDRVEVEALQGSSGLLATRVDRDDDDDEVSIQAPVESFVDGSSVTILGLRYNVASAEFENAGDDDIDGATFFRNLRIGSLIEVIDDQPLDGFAEEVEFEFATSLDGDREFVDRDEERLDSSELPEAVLNFLAERFPNTDIAFIERDDEEIEVYLANGTEVVFDLDGGFIEADVDDDDDDDSDEDFDDESDGDTDDDSEDDSDDDGDSDDDADDDSDDSSDDADDDSDDSSDDDSDDGADDDSDDDTDDDTDDDSEDDEASSS